MKSLPPIRAAAIATAIVAGLFSTGLLANGPTATLGAGSKFKLAGRNGTVTNLDTLPLVENNFTKRFKFDIYGNPKLKQLREQYKLDAIVSPGKDEFGRQVLLLDWVNHQFKKFGRPTANPRGAAEILHDIQQGHTFFCAQYADVFVSAAASLGWVDRSLALRRPNNIGEGSTEHSSTEIWSNQFRKWVMLDPTFAMYAEKNGMPLSAYELRQAWFNHDAKGVTFVLDKERKRYHKSEMPILRGRFPGFGDLNFDSGAVNPYAFIGYVPNTNLMDAGPDYGKMFIFQDKLCDGTQWHKRDIPTDLTADAYFPIGQATMTLSAEGDHLRVGLKTMTPNFKTFLVRTESGEWKPSGDTFAWKVHSGTNRLEAKTVNLFGVDGPISTAEVEIEAEAAVITPQSPAEAMKSLQAIGAQFDTGKDGFVSIWFPDKAKLTDAGMPLFRGLRKMYNISLYGMPISDAGLVYLSDFTGLQTLSLHATKVTDRGLSSLKGLTELRSLDLSDTTINGAGLANLANSTKLVYLFVQNTPFNDAGMAHLRDHPNLRRVFLSATKITDAGLTNLSGLKQIECLLLDDTQITDAGLAHLANLQSLRYLWLRNSKVTDAGLENLKGIAKLHSLRLTGTKVTGGGVSGLRKALPNCRIEVK